MFKEKITNEELANLPLKCFEGEITVVDSHEKIHKACEILSVQHVIGFDTETRPSFKKGMVNTVALLQLSTCSQAFLFRINKIGLPPEICSVLANPGIIKAGVAIRDDIKVLQKICKFNPRGFVELQDYARSLGIQDFSLKKLAAIVCGFRISKTQQISNWDVETLTQSQIIYAATDAWIAQEIFMKFSNAQ
ncbi:MAG: 3'-5' exonuclease domain-containing protein 2 [Bacteroidales bacterium]|jgi:ribonuclease D|nr:3'-5' exonuclease domain-containing protein 2 [Bacteroidales bacterium]